jgi:hypothetical protein
LSQFGKQGPKKKKKKEALSSFSYIGQILFIKFN